MGRRLLTNPGAGAQDIALTAEALATQLPSGMLKIEGMPDIAGLPDVSAFLSPDGVLIEVWRGIPIMRGASAGEEFDGSAYSYLVAGADGMPVE